ncbi:YecA family protein [Salinicola peritrichatus]|uniref:YecA/YgfB family protein n=1 Tax=Salinicola peritrichatus TaxID=1267424 RepID=UPI000DA20881|nr:YecA family protein [Salinicola peritrichatus]
MSVDQQDAIDSRPPLDDEALARLDDYLTAERLGEETPDVIGVHGYLVALAVAPRTIAPQRWVAELFEGEPPFADDAERDDILGLLDRLKSNAGDILELGDWIELPFDTELDEDGDTAVAIEDWCAGFMQGVFLDEAAWFAQDEAHVAALLLPFMALSGLFDDEPEMAELVADEQQFVALASQLPELTLDLYLHFRVPPEPKAQSSKTKSNNPDKSAKSGSRRRRGGKR